MSSMINWHYSVSYLTQLEGDLQLLADDADKAGKCTSDVMKLRNAAQVIRKLLSEAKG